MPQFCAVANCGSNSARDKGISFFKFPSELDCSRKVNKKKQIRRLRWIQALKRDDLTEKKLKNERVCSRHFISGAPASLDDEDNPDWTPNVALGHKKAVCETSVAAERYNRRMGRKRRLETGVLANIQTTTTILTNENIDENLAPRSEESNNILQTLLQENGNLNKALLHANTTIYALRSEVKKFSFKIDSFRCDNERTLFFTGLKSFDLLLHVYNFIESEIDFSHSSSLSRFEMLVLTLMKLRLNSKFTDLGYRFNISRRTASRIFYKCLNLLYFKLKWLIHWPSKTELVATMPQVFRETFDNKVTVIIDCFEVFTEKSSNMNAAAQTFSSYKHHQTIKFLIGVSPQGTIMYMSQAFGGRSSDKFITENSGFLDKLNAGDLILADRGFVINDSVELYLAEVKTPAFLSGKKQLHPRDIENTRSLARVRIHVERIIGTLKQKYTIFSETLPMLTIVNENDKNLAFIDKIVTVCCALCNLCPSVVPY